MAQTVDIAALVEKMPDLDKTTTPNRSTETGKLTGPSWGDAEKLIEPILAGGRQSLLRLIDMITVQELGNHKVRYTIHAIALYVCRPNKDDQQAMFVQTLASQLRGNRPKAVQLFLVRELQCAGGPAAVAAIGKLLGDAQMCDEAAAALLAIGTGAAQQFRAALPDATGRCRLAIVQALGTLRDAESAAALKSMATDRDPEIRLAAVWGLANMGDASSVDLLIAAADAQGFERIKATQAILLLAEKLAAAGQKGPARRIYQHLAQTRTEKAEQYIRDAAREAMAAL